MQSIVIEIISNVTSKITPLETGDKKYKNIIIPMIEDCTMCKHCQDMKKFGGPGKMKQRCILKKELFKKKKTVHGGNDHNSR